ncbi:plant transposase [Striga asiatica]|uniref:Plant transposase n=1 Tax=Striga asiatica TaxID=4170 RepID=A0A5A7R168_STRAF|nr:plant transposase [Striga asiatica]
MSMMQSLAVWEMEMSEYESIRRRIVEENKRKMEELGLRPVAYEKMNLKKPAKQVNINKTLRPTQDFQNDDEPTLGKGDHSKKISKQDNTQGFGTILNLRSCSKKVIASENVEPERIADEQQLSMATMASLIKSRSQTRKRLLEQSKAKNQCDEGALKLKQPLTISAPPLQEVPPKQAEDNSHGKTQALNNVNQPESLRHQGVRVELFEDDNGYEIGSSHKQQHSNVYAVEENDDPIVAETNEQILMQDRHIDQPVLEKKRRTRGPTMCKDVHAWTLDERRPIFFNVKGQPIGPDQETLTKFSMFLGTISRDSTLAPLNKVDWRHVTGKDKIFDYVKKKFIIPEEAMEYVLSSVGDLWRSHKCRIKKKHYTGYENDKERWMNRPKSISDSHFKELLEYWKLDEVKPDNEPSSSLPFIILHHHLHLTAAISGNFLFESRPRANPDVSNLRLQFFR